MQWLEQEAETEFFVWEVAAEIDAEPSAEETVETKVVTLRNTALEALDTVAEEATETETNAPTIEAPEIEPDDETETTTPATVVEVASSGPEEQTEAVKTVSVETVEELGNPDEEYITECIALFHEIYPGGIEALFANGIAEGMFTLAWGNGPVSGQDSWTNADLMVLDAVYKLTEDAGIDLRAVWNDFTEIMVEKLYPEGVDIENLSTGLLQKGPISGQSEWTYLDYRAFDLVKSMLWAENMKGEEEINPLEVFNDLYPNGISELFPDGYSDEALETLLEGNGLYSGEADWDEADEIVFEGLWQALVDNGIYPFAGEDEYEPLPFVIEDGLVYPMPIVIDDGEWFDGEWFEGEADYPVMVGCDLMPPPEMVVCTFVNEDLALI